MCEILKHLLRTNYIYHKITNLLSFSDMENGTFKSQHDKQKSHKNTAATKTAFTSQRLILSNTWLTWSPSRWIKMGSPHVFIANKQMSFWLQLPISVTWLNFFLKLFRYIIYFIIVKKIQDVILGWQWQYYH